MGSVGTINTDFTPTRTNEEALRMFDKLKNFGKKNKRTKQYDMKENPLFDNGNDDDRYRATDLYLHNDDFYNQNIKDKKWPLKAFDLSDVSTYQPWVDIKGIHNGITQEQPHEYKKYKRYNDPVGVQIGDKIYLMDGNHRAVTAWARGQKKIKIRVAWKE